MRKAVSEIIVVVLILMISISLVGVAYVFLMQTNAQTIAGIQGYNDASLKRIGSCIKLVSFDSNTNNLWVKNCGKYSIDNVRVFLNNSPKVTVAFSANPGETKNITITVTSGVYEVRLDSDYASAISIINK